MTDPRPLTPPEVRELLRRVATMERSDRIGSRVVHPHDTYALSIAMDEIPALRFTLERYAELAEAFSGE